MWGIKYVVEPTTNAIADHPYVSFPLINAEEVSATNHFAQPDVVQLPNLNSLTAKSCSGGGGNSRPEGFLLAKHKHTNIPTMIELFPPQAPWF